MYSNSVLVAECLLMSESATILITQALAFSKQPWIAQPGVIKGLLFTLTNCKLIWINLWSVNWAVLQSPEQTQWLRTAALLWPEISWGVTQSRVRGYWVLKCSEQDDRAAPLAFPWFRGKWSSSGLITFPAAQGNSSPSPQTGGEALPGPVENKKYREIRRWLLPVCAGSWTRAPMEAPDMNMGKKWFLLNLKQPGMAPWVATASWELVIS